jgi:NADH-quinone oxidoreductase subunit E
MLTEAPTASAPAQEHPFDALCAILDRFGNDPTKLIPILQAIQHEYKYLPEDVLTYTAVALGLSPARVYGVASFYAHFTLKPKGKYVVRLCDGTACHVKGTPPILAAIRENLQLAPDRDTTPDMLFTVEIVSCLGACGLAPVMVVNEDVHGQLTPEAAVAVIEAIQEKEGAL